MRSILFRVQIVAIRQVVHLVISSIALCEVYVANICALMVRKLFKKGRVGLDRNMTLQYFLV